MRSFFSSEMSFLWTIQDPKQYKEISYYEYDLIPLTSSCPICRTELKQVFSLKECKYKYRYLRRKPMRSLLARFL